MCVTVSVTYITQTVFFVKEKKVWSVIDGTKPIFG